MIAVLLPVVLPGCLASDANHPVAPAALPPEPDHAVLSAAAAPTANDDAFVVNEDNILDVAAPGVLANDTDPESDALLSKLASALAVLAGGDCEGARNKIQAFINQVNALLGSGRLTAEQAADLIDAAGAVLADSDC